MTTKKLKTTSLVDENSSQDPVSGFKDIQIRRLAYRAGNQRIENDTYNRVREIIESETSSILRKILVFTTHTDRKTVTLDDLEGALESEGKFLMAGSNTAREIRKSKAKPKKVKKFVEEGSSTDTPKKAYRNKPGKVANQEIKRLQETSDRLIFKQNRFEAYLRNLTRKQLDKWNQSDINLRFAGEFFKLFQLILEEILVHLLEKAKRAAEHAGRKSISKRDIDFIYLVC